METKIHYGKDARTKLQTGIDKLADSICLLISTAFSPLSRWDNPFLIISLANKVEVVVPSPAFSAVLTAACLINN